MKRILLLSIILIISQITKSQNLEKHQWKNRLLLVFSNGKNTNEFKEQINILSKDKQGLIERKLIIYQFSKNIFTTDFNTVWFSSKRLAKKYLPKENSFQVILVGLDGEVKLKQSKIVSLEELFTLIDVMPMRRRELKN